MRDVSFVGRGRARVPRARDASVRANGSVRTPRTMRVVRIEKRLWTHLWTRVVRLGVPRVGPAFPAVRCVEPGFAHRTLSREIHVSAPKRAAADVTRPRGPLPRTARLIGTSRRDRRGLFLRGGPHRPRQRASLCATRHGRRAFVSSFSRLPRTGICSTFPDLNPPPFAHTCYANST